MNGHFLCGIVITVFGNLKDLNFSLHLLRLLLFLCPGFLLRLNYIGKHFSLAHFFSGRSPLSLTRLFPHSRGHCRTHEVFRGTLCSRAQKEIEPIPGLCLVKGPFVGLVAYLGRFSVRNFIDPFFLDLEALVTVSPRLDSALRDGP